MSKLMRDLQEAEQRRKNEAAQPSPEYELGHDHELDHSHDHEHERKSEAAALSWLTEEANGTARALEFERIQREAQEAARRRTEAEAAAVAQARARLKAETAARAVTLERVAAERDRQRLARQRLEAELLAQAEAKRREEAVTELRAAIAARLADEEALKAATETRLAAEQSALAVAEDKLKMERMLESLMTARAVTERDLADVGDRRLLREAEVDAAQAARGRAEIDLQHAMADAQRAGSGLDGFESPTLMVDPHSTIPVPEVREQPAPPRHGIWPALAASALLLGGLLGWLAADQFAPAPVAERASNAPGKVIAPVATPAIAPTAPERAAATTDVEQAPPVTADLRMDDDLDAFATRLTSTEFQDSSRRRVSPSANQ